MVSFDWWFLFEHFLPGIFMSFYYELFWTFIGHIYLVGYVVLDEARHLFLRQVSERGNFYQFGKIINSHKRLMPIRCFRIDHTNFINSSCVSVPHVSRGPMATPSQLKKCLYINILFKLFFEHFLKAIFDEN